MGFETLLGNERLKENLKESLAKGHISHCYLISGPEGSGKRTLARLLAAAILCQGKDKPCGVCAPCRKVLDGNHPDYILVDDPEKKTVPVTTIDAVAAGRAISYIKMDVEGAEVQALAGGIVTISKYAPKLFVAAYHYDVDLFRLPLLMWQLVPDYKIYLRKHPYVPAWELNFIAVK